MVIIKVLIDLVLKKITTKRDIKIIWMGGGAIFFLYLFLSQYFPEMLAYKKQMYYLFGISSFFLIIYNFWDADKKP
tara:strand:- start:44 stop:271 length:228 start_codon:yes stop_codon:yes gene_type:complete